MTGSGEVAGGPAESGGDLLGAGGDCCAAGEAEYGHGGGGPRRPGADGVTRCARGGVRYIGSRSSNVTAAAGFLSSLMPPRAAVTRPTQGR